MYKSMAEIRSRELVFLDDLPTAFPINLKFCMNDLYGTHIKFNGMKGEK